MTMTVGEFQGLIASGVPWADAEAALKAAGGFSASTPISTPIQTPIPTPIPTTTVGGNMAEISQYQYDLLTSLGQDMTGYTVPAEWSDPIATAPEAVAAAGVNGQERVHAYWGPGSPYAGAYIGLVSAADAASLTNANYEVRSDPPEWAPKAEPAAEPAAAPAAAPGAASIDQQIMDRLDAEEVIPLSELAQMSDSGMQTRAATQLAKNIVKQLGNSQDAINLVRGIFGEYFDTPESGGFGTWAASVGLTGLGEIIPVSTDLSSQQSTWSKSYGAPGSQKAMDFIAAMDAGEFSRMTKDFKAYYSKEHAARIESQSPATSVDISYKPGLDPKDIITPATDDKPEDRLRIHLMDLAGSGRAYTFSSAMDQVTSDFANKPSLFPGWSDTGRPDSEFRAWLSDLYIGMSNDTREGLFKLFGPSLQEGPLPIEGGLDPNIPGGYEALLPFGGVGAERTFGDVYGGFVGGLPGIQMPSISGALRSAGDPLRTQFWMQQPGLPQVGEGGEFAGRTAAVDFLNSLMQGTGGILRGPELGGALRNIASALTGDPNMLGMGALGGEGSAQSQYYDRFKTLEAQRKAFEQPFLLSTVGAPEKRSALQAAISRAATQFEYKYPGGVPIEGGTGTQNFLPWAISQNLLGIQDLLPSLARPSPTF